MQVEKEDVLHIAKLACLKLKEEEIEEYRKNLQDILNFANTVNEAALLQNAPEKQNNMFSIPKVI